ncbi:DUF4012 domain-containing protein [Candidatus Nomurabacteria bacterium]|nr:DUF4012 domain-containing protein [Candidatus Nomurabacteria bacterium]
MKERRSLKRRRFKLPSFSLKGSSSNKVLGATVGVLLVIAVVGYFCAYRPAMRIKAQGEKVIAAGQEAKAAFKENDIDLVEKKMSVVETEFASFQDEAKSVYWMQYIPLAGLYVKDFRNGVEAGEHLLIAGKKTITAIKPHADLIGFKKGEDVSFTQKPAEERLETAVLTLDQILGDVDSIAEEVDIARDKIALINENRYPKQVKGIMLRDLIKNNKAQFAGIASLFVDAKPFIKALPDILGSKESKKYLVLFQNDKELRATGGFLTAYSVFEVDKGKFSVSSSDDIYTLDSSIPVHPKATREISTYHKGVSQLYIRDSNLSPDFPTSVKLFDDLYQNSKRRVEYDGVIAVDTHVLVGALEILGDTQVRGITFSSRIDKRCDCPQVIYTLLDEIDRPVAYIKEDRRGILGDLLLTLTQKALGFSPSQYWGRLSQMLMADLQEKHVLIYMTDPALQKSVESINFAGRIKPYDGDYVHISDVNFAGAKSNLYVQHQVVSNTVFKDGTVERTLEITYKNPYPHSNCNLEDGGGLGRGGLCINATLRNWLRIYVPEGSKLVSFKGSEKKVQTYDELGKTVFEGFMGVKPEGQSKVFVTYTLPSTVKKDNYSLLIQKQPGTIGHDYTVKIDNRTFATFPLVTDKEINLAN